MNFLKYLKHVKNRFYKNISTKIVNISNAGNLSNILNIGNAGNVSNVGNISNAGNSSNTCISTMLVTSVILIISVMQENSVISIIPAIQGIQYNAIGNASNVLKFSDTWTNVHKISNTCHE